MPEIKIVQTERKVDFAKREVEAYASIFNNRDRVGDNVRPGAFLKTLAEGWSRVAVKYNHDILIGRPLHIEEDSKGLFTRSYISKTPTGDEKLTQMDDGSLPTLSFKYAIVDGKFDYEKSDGARNLRELKLYEYGPVDPDLACNPATSIVSVKGGFCNVWEWIDTLASYVYGLQAADRLTPEEINMLKTGYQRLVATTNEAKTLLEKHSMKLLREPGEATPSTEPGAATQPAEPVGGSSSPQEIAVKVALELALLDRKIAFASRARA